MFEAQEPSSAGCAYRMLGSMAEADDVLQEAWIPLAGRRPARGGGAGGAFLSRTVTRLVPRPHEVRRVRRPGGPYVGSWLPEPVFEPPEEGPPLGRAEPHPDAGPGAPLARSERAAFLLHDVFGVAARRGGHHLCTASRQPCVQLAVRARSHVQALEAPALSAVGARREATASPAPSSLPPARGAISRACARSSPRSVVLQADGGGKAHAFLKADHRSEQGRPPVRRPAPQADHTAPSIPDPLDLDRRPAPASSATSATAPLQTTALEIEDGRITAIYITRNPDKLVEAGARLTHGRDALSATPTGGYNPSPRATAGPRPSDAGVRRCSQQRARRRRSAPGRSHRSDCIR